VGEALPDHLRLVAHATDRASVVQCHEARSVVVASELAPVEGVRLHGGGPIGGCALFVTTAEDGGSLLALPPEIRWQIRGTFGRFSEAVAGASGAVAAWADGWASRGSLVFVSGRTYEGFELWARSVGAGPLRLFLRWHVVPGGSPGAPSVTAGTLT